jgi:hypothetical protein
MAKETVKGGTSSEEFGVTQRNMHLWLSRCALGFNAYAEVFAEVFEDPARFLTVPFFLTVNLLATFVPKGRTIWEFVDQIEAEYEGAWLLDLNLLPALMVRSRMPQPEQTPGASTASN